MSVQYNEAMQTLTVMFESVDKEVIDAVLRANEWHMERTIDALLAMSDTSAAPPVPSADVPQVPPETDPIVDIPPVNPQQMEQDEMLARALQNEMFLTESRTETEKAPESNEDDTLKEVKDKFNQLGEAAKSKLREFSNFFKKDEKSVAGDITSGHEQLHDDDEEIIAFDRRNLQRRAAPVDDDDEEDGGLEDRRPHRVAQMKSEPTAIPAAVPLTASGGVRRPEW